VDQAVKPVTGEVRVRGRVSALLELGSGFNPEYTGRENVFLNGTILGLSQNDVTEKFDEIAAFADIGDYIDQPVKTYSSGMFARLAFAVAICTEPEILIADEILAVGDMAFQQKCVARMHEMRERGMTLLFVSHSPDTVKSVCQKGLFLIDGHPNYWGPAERAVDLYYSYIRQQTNKEAMEAQAELARPIYFHTLVPGLTRYGTGHVQIQKVRTLNEAGEPQAAFSLGETIILEATVKSYIEAEHLSLSFLVRDSTGIDLLGTTTFDERIELPALALGQQVVVRFQFTVRLHTGNYGVSLAVNRVSHADYSDAILFDQVDGCAAFTVIPKPGRPVHYKVHEPVQIDYDLAEIPRDGSDLAAN
jgi:lipopolysaccharide transport system ATP-binding protein